MWWWTPTTHHQSQTHAALSRLLTAPSPQQPPSTSPSQPQTNANTHTFTYANLNARLGLVELDDKSKAINTLVIDNDDPHLQKNHLSAADLIHTLTATDQSSNAVVQEIGENTENKKILVMCHGYGAGLGFFYKNYPALARVPNLRVYSIDWLGMANSSRPPWPSHGKTEQDQVTIAEDFFVDSFELWREQNRISSMILMGHSLGGYLAAVYAMKYPSRVEKLILVSPAGIPALPSTAVAARLPTWAVKFWNWGFTPFSIIRAAGPFGPSLVHRYVQRRFAYFEDEEAADFKAYIYHTAAQRGSGEYALASLLLPGAWARSPLADRLGGKDRGDGTFEGGVRCPTSFVYGNLDWMNYEHSLGVSRQISKNADVETRVCVVRESGHHLYLDNPLGFNRSIINELTDFDITQSKLDATASSLAAAETSDADADANDDGSSDLFYVQTFSGHDDVLLWESKEETLKMAPSDTGEA